MTKFFCFMLRGTVAVAVFAVAGFLMVLPRQAVSADGIPFAFVALGDNGCGCTGQKLVADRLIEWHQQKPFYTVVMLGDNIYGLFSGGNKTLFADRFDKYYQPLLEKGVKFYAALGNHDVETRQGLDEINDKNRFHITGALGYYSFSPAPEVNGKPLIAFFVLNSERLLKPNADRTQIEWLSRELTASKAIWKVVHFHDPIYAPGGAHAAAEDLKQAIEKLLLTAGVSLVLAGHDHYYARMRPQNGVTYFISGGGGRPLATPKQSDMAVVVAKQYHFLYFEVFPDQLRYAAIPKSLVSTNFKVTEKTFHCFFKAHLVLPRVYPLRNRTQNR